MISARIIDADHGPRLIIEESETHTREIDLVNIAGLSELLGIADLGETLAAIIYNQDHPEPDDTDPMAEPFTLLAHRERARDEEAAKANAEGRRDDPRSPRLRGALAAYQAVHIPVDGGECVMDRCRREARATMGLNEPTRKASSATRANPAAVKVSGEFADLLAPHAEVMDKLRSHFLHDTADTGGDDPLVPPAPEPGPVDPVDELFKKYGGAA